jgi:hypothetical protein
MLRPCLQYRLLLLVMLLLPSPPNEVMWQQHRSLAAPNTWR